jgi:hypothetical protein
MSVCSRSARGAGHMKSSCSRSSASYSASVGTGNTLRR